MSYVLVAIIVLGQIADIASTFSALDHGLSEGNPIVRAFGRLWWAVKLAVAFVVMVAIWPNVIALAAVALATWIVVAWNIWLIRRRT